MKHAPAFLILFLILLTLPLRPVRAQSRDPQALLGSADEEIFIRPYFTQDFTENQGYVNEFQNEKTIHQYFIYEGTGTDRLISLLPAEEGIRTTNKRLGFPQYRMNEFHITYSVQQSQTVPGDESGDCWIRFSNIVMQGEGKESGVILFPGGQAYSFAPEEGQHRYEPIADLSDLDAYSMNRFDFIRLEGTTYVYANGEYRFSFTDSMREGVSFEAGAELFEGGNIIRCDFDDFSVRIR